MTVKPSFKFCPGDWMKDPALGMCSPQTRGVWIDFLCAISDCGRSGQVTGTIEQLSRIGRCTTTELDVALNELSQSRTADISERDGVFTVTQRRGE